jgi:hypothetical protein
MEISEESLFQSVKEIIRQSREKVFRIANSTLLLTYWQIGKLIVEDVQNNWNVRDLKRKMNSLAYERVLKHKESSPESIHSVLKDPYIFEFLGIKADEQFSEKDETIVKYSVLNDKNNLFASKYLLYLPKEEELNKSSIRTEFVLN